VTALTTEDPTAEPDIEDAPPAAPETDEAPGEATGPGIEAVEESDPEAAPTVSAEVLERIGALALTADQTRFTPRQDAVLRALGWDMARIKPAHVDWFVHFCLSHGVDPFAGEAMLFIDSEGNPVPILMIAGFRRQAMRSGEYRGVDGFEYSDGGEWFDTWAPGMGRPVACRAVAHREGWVPVPGIAVTEEVEVYEHVKTDDPNERTRRAKRWESGREGGKLLTMLAKCAEAAALRRAFPRELDGFYTPEEMTRVRKERQEEARRKEAAAARQRIKEAYEAEHGVPDDDVIPLVTEPVEGQVVEHQGRRLPPPADPAAAIRDLRERGRVHAEAAVPEPVAAPEPEPAPAPMAEPRLTEDDVIRLLRAELVEQAAILAVPLSKLTARHERAFELPFDDWPLPDLRGVVERNRSRAADALRKQARYGEAQSYSEVRPGEVDEVSKLFGRD